MTFMRKLLDVLNMENLGSINGIKTTPSSHKNTSIPKVSSKEPKWASIRDAKEIEIEQNTLDLKEITIFFNNGIICDVIPDVYCYYQAQYYNIDGVIYDSYSVNSINSIPIPDYSKVKATGTPVYNLEYILNMRASHERKIGNNLLAYTLLEKSLELMQYSNIIYSKNQILRITNWMYEDGKFSDAQKKEEELRKKFPSAFNKTLIHKKAFQRTLQSCKDLKTDYIVCNSHQGTCEECAKYQCRVYCISGRDKRFPKLPNIVYEYGGFHEGCRHMFYPFLLDINKTIKDYDLNEYDVYKHSNRPFIDDRNDYDKQLNIEYLEKRRKEFNAEQSKKMYYYLKEKIPNIMPKSLGGFTKMKNDNSTKYQEIVKAAHDIGIDI